MALKHSFDLLTIRYQKRYKNKGFVPKQNTGIDTETYNGYCKLICADNGKHKDIENFDDVIQFLTHHYFRKKFNWFFNIQFDFEGMIKHLDYAQLLELYSEKEIELDRGITLSYIPHKYFALKDKSRNNYYFYDIHGFIDGSLNNASKEMLGDEKLNIVDANKLNTDINYWKQNKDIIVEYCIKDAVLTKRLSDKFWNIVYTNMNFYPKQPISKGKLSEEYFSHKCDIPTINYIPEGVIKYACNAYYGGHFEILKRGYIEKVYSYDISSAYPAEIAELIDYNNGKWEKTGVIHEEAYTGYYLCKISFVDNNFSPFMQKIGGDKGGNIYPNGKYKQFLTKKEIDFISLHFPNAQIKIESGWEFFIKQEIKPFKEEINRLYQWKEKETNGDVKKCVKIILNSLYGKFIQVSPDRFITGKLFNPCYGAEITANTRLKMMELALQKPECIVSFATDGVVSTEPLKCKYNGLGDFKKEFEGEGVFLMSGVYNLWNYDTKKVINKLRGFNLVSVKDMDKDTIYLKDVLENLKGQKYKYTSVRPDHLGECIAHCKTKTIKGNLNVFSSHDKEVDINGDNKRVWDKDFKSGKQCLKESHNSIPLIVGVV